MSIAPVAPQRRRLEPVGCPHRRARLERPTVWALLPLEVAQVAGLGMPAGVADRPLRLRRDPAQWRVMAFVHNPDRGAADR